MASYSPLSNTRSDSWIEPDDPASNIIIDDPIHEELVEEETESRNWKGILISILVIVTVISLVIVAIVIVTPDEVVVKHGDKLTLDEILNGTLRPFVIEPIWIDGGLHFIYRDKYQQLIYYECESNYSTVFVDNSPFRELNTEEYHLSPDRRYILLPHHVKQIYKHYKVSRYKIYDTETKLLNQLTGPGGLDFQYITWTHTGQGLIVVQGNNIYFRASMSDNSSFHKLTYTGKEGVVYNGIPNWLYGEEILQSRSALWLSPGDDFLLFAMFNDSDVTPEMIQCFGDVKNKYTSVIGQRYSKASTRNPTFQLRIYHMASNKTLTLHPPASFAGVSEYYFISVAWRNNITVAVVWINRAQNVSIVTICSAITGVCYENLRLNQETGWIHTNWKFIFTSESDEYFLILPRKDGDKGLFDSVAFVDSSVNLRTSAIEKLIFLTIGELEVKEIVGYENDTVYFLAIPFEDSRQQHLFRTTTNKDHPEFRQPTCISCGIGLDCLYVDAIFGPGEYYILGCLGPGVPRYSIYTKPDSFLTALDVNDDVAASLETKLLPVDDYIRVSLPDNNHVMTKMILPPALKKAEIIRYHAIIYVNEHIGDHAVTFKFDVGWAHFLSSYHGVIVVFLDPRGTSGRGGAWLHGIHGNVGEPEVEDVVTVASYLKDQQYVHENIVIVGKGYGGYIATGALSSPNNPGLHCGVAVSPITDFQYMSSFYAERYLGQNVNVIYNKAKLSNHVANLKHSEYLVMHGTMDDRIHFQHTAQLIRNMVTSQVHHQTRIFTDKRDLLDDADIQEYVLIDMEKFILNCFNLPDRTDTPKAVVEDEEDDDE